ncbi:MAG: S24 family peptidase [Parafilimonas sp.]
MRKIEKIFQYIESQNISTSSFERKSGLGNSYLKKTRDRGKDLSPKILEKIVKNNPKDYYSIFPEEQKGDVYLEQRRNLKNTDTPFMVPLVPVKAQAGYVRAYDQQTYIDTLEKYALPPGVNPRGAVWRYWEVEGDSMEPVFYSGDIILTSQVHQFDWENLRNFYLYVIVTDDAVLFKRIYCKNNFEWVLISENEDLYKQQILPVEFVKEVWVYRRSIVSKAPPTKMFEIKV